VLYLMCCRTYHTGYIELHNVAHLFCIELNCSELFRISTCSLLDTLAPVIIIY